MKRRFGRTIAVIALSVCLCLGLAACTGETGKSAYELAVENGYRGTVTEWLDSLKGDNGQDKTLEALYQSEVENGYSGTFLEFVQEELLQGDGADSGIAAINQSLLSTVSINATAIYQTGGGAFTKPTTKTEVSAGSGVIYQLDKEQGHAYIVTNYHVVFSENANSIAEKIQVWLYGSEVSTQALDATYIGGTQSNDIAVLAVQSETLKTAPVRAVDLADSDAIPVGSPVFAVGNPEGNGISATAGILSVDSENITVSSSATSSTATQVRAMRIDAAVNGGNSGGGLYTEQGRLAGIVNAKLVDESVEGIAYAIPMNTVKPLADKIIATCDGVNTVHPTAPKLGITVRMESSRAVYDSLTLLTHIEETLVVDSVSEGVANGKLLAQDVLVSYSVNGGDNVNITRMHHLSTALLGSNEGDVMTITVIRNGTRQDVEMTLGAGIVIE